MTYYDMIYIKYIGMLESIKKLSIVSPKKLNKSGDKSILSGVW